MFGIGHRAGRCRPPGLTLVEFLFAISVMAVAALGVVGMFPSAFRSVVAGGDMTKATMLAQTMTEMLRGEPFADLVTKYNGFTTAASITGYACPVTASTNSTNYIKMRMKCEVSPEGAQASGQGLPGGVVGVQVQCVNTSGAAATCSTTDLRLVTATVSWRRGVSRSVRLVSYVARWE